MKLILVLGISAFSFMTAYGQDNWKDYEFQSHNFKIKFYQRPEFTIDSTSFNDPILITYNWSLNVIDTLHENSYYSISVVTYPSYFIHSDSSFSVVEGFINSSQDGVLEDETFTLLTSTLIEKHGFPGKVFKWKNSSNNVFFEFQVFLVENALFMLSVVSRESKNHNIYINGFFNNFQIINVAQGNFKIPLITNQQTYTIDFPGQPKEQNNILDTESGKLSAAIKTYEPKVNDENLVYVAMETKYPNNFINQNDTYALNNFYKKVIDGSLNAVNGELISINDIYYNGKLGKEYRCYFSEGKILMIYRTFYINDNVYSFGVLTLPENSNNKAMKKYFDSFKIKY